MSIKYHQLVGKCNSLQVSLYKLSHHQLQHPLINGIIIYYFRRLDLNKSKRLKYVYDYTITQCVLQLMMTKGFN